MKKNFLFLLCGVVSPLMQAKDWPQWRGPDRNGLSTEIGVIRSWEKAPPQLLWKAEGAGRGFSSVSIADGILYTSGNFEGEKAGQGVSAFSVKDGKLLWQTPITDFVPKHGYQGARSAPTVEKNRLYVTTSSGVIRYQSGHVALVKATPEGYKLKGSFMPAHQEAESWAHPVVSDGKLYLREQNHLMCYQL